MPYKFSYFSAVTLGVYDEPGAITAIILLPDGGVKYRVNWAEGRTSEHYGEELRPLEEVEAYFDDDDSVDMAT
jgi:hypothetical protein